MPRGELLEALEALEALGALGVIGVIGNLESLESLENLESLESLENLENLGIKNYSLLSTLYSLLSTHYFLSEVVRCGASQKKDLRDSTKSYSPKVFVFSDVPQIAAYHKKLFEGAEHKLKLLILVLNNILLSWKTTPRVYATYTHLSLVDVDIGVTILNKALRVLAVVL